MPGPRWRTTFAARAAMVGTSLLLYGLSLALPALRFSVSNGDIRVPAGWEVLLLGWLALFAFNVGWLANLAYAVSLLALLLGAWRTTLVSACVALLFAADTLMLFRVSLYADEGGVTHMLLERLEPGFFVWLAAMTVVAAAAFWTLRQRSRADGAGWFGRRPSG